MPRQVPTKTENTPKWAAELTLRERRFVEEYCIDLNGKQAAIRAGLGKTVKSATEMASRMRKRPLVAAAISQLVSERTGGTAAAVLNELGAIAFADIFDIVRIDNGRLVVNDLNQLTKEQRAAVAEISEVVNDDGSISWKLKLHDKLGALDKIGKSIGLFKEREVAHTHELVSADDMRQRILARLSALKKAQLAEPSAEIEPPVQRAKPVPAKVGPVIDAE